MMRNELSDAYFDWMYRLVCSNDRGCETKFYKLLEYLNEVDFEYSLPMDGNRAENGVCLRYRFGDACGYTQNEVVRYIDIKPCSVLEMMVALALRCEEQIMEDPDFGDRTGVWFWEMVESLGLDNMDDKHFNQHFVERTVRQFLFREYLPNGYGGLFYIRNSEKDLREIEIWDQMCMHINDVY